MNTSKFLNRLFRRVTGVVWDVITGSVGLQTADGIYTVSFDQNNKATLNVNPIDDFGLALPAFATQTTAEEVKEGDIIVGDQGIIGWVTGKGEASFKVLDHNGMNKNYSPPKVAILGNQGVLVVRNLMSLTGGATGANNFASMLMPLIALGGGDDKLEKLLPLLLLTSQNGALPTAAGAAGTGMNNLLPFLLMKDGGVKGGSMEKLLPFLLLSGGGSGGAMNPLLMMSLLGDGDILGCKSEDSVAPKTRNGVPTVPPLTRM